jgi:tetratricopeptide (TPR) repeat protein
MAGFTELTRRLRDDRGISVRQLAELVHYDQGGMSRILRGLQPCPPYLARVIDDVLGAGGAIAAAAAEAPAPPPDTEKTRCALETALSAGMMSGGTLADWEQSVDAYGYRTRDTPSPVLLADLLGDLRDLRLAVDQHRSASALPRLALAGARMSGLVCLVLIRAGDRQAFRRWGRTARHAAIEAGDGTAQSWAMAQEAYGYYYAGDMPAAIACARGALAAAPHPCVGGALAAALEMRAHAATGDAPAARRALDEAERIHASLSGPDVAASAFGYGESQLRFHAGDALTRLGDTTAARPVLEHALRLCAPGDYTDRSLVLLDLAACAAADGDWVTALASAARVLEDLDVARIQGIIAGRARELLAAVPPAARTLPAARDFRDLIDESAKEITPP